MYGNYTNAPHKFDEILRWKTKSKKKWYKNCLNSGFDVDDNNNNNNNHNIIYLYT